LSATAARASTSPEPTASGPNAPIGTAVVFCASLTCAGVRPGLPWSWSAATAAACGAAAEVPKNRNVPPPALVPKNVLAPPSVAVTSGLDSTSGCGSGAAAEPPETGAK
jgi:hypothetical protein